MDKQEKIVCAAIEFTTEDLFISTQQDKYVLCGVGYEEIKNFNNSVICREVLHTQNGFITSKNRFVDAKEAVDIANNAHQIKELARLYGEYFKINDTGSHKDAKNAFKKYMDRVNEKRADGLKPEDLY